MTRTEHLQWAKDRAKEHSNPVMMWTSFVNDLSKHPELKNHIAIKLGNMTGVMLKNRKEVERFIDGFN